MIYFIIIFSFLTGYQNSDSCKVARQNKIEFRKQNTVNKLDSILVKLENLKSKKNEKIKLSKNRNK